MLVQEIIRRKRDGAALSEPEIAFLVRGITDGSIGDGQVAAFAMAVFFRGMTMDERGNLYLTGQDISIYSPDGIQIGSIAVREAPANLTFGGRGRKTLFITARTSLYAVRMTVNGQ
ncbi:MAG: SMP-30/gluconolactonase/LRE family protein [Proteobacteria bacterium]|nr:SMP-30/gluconolactonase/LRE family protein [Pseudomonadota bacterium]